MDQSGTTYVTYKRSSDDLDLHLTLQLLCHIFAQKYVFLYSSDSYIGKPCIDTVNSEILAKSIKRHICYVKIPD